MPEEQEMTLEQLQQMAAEHDSAEPEIPSAEEMKTERAKAEPEPTQEPPEPEGPPPMADSPPTQEPVVSGEDGSLKSEATSKFDKDKARANKAWQKINLEKERNASDREELAEMRKRINQASPKEKFIDEKGLSASDYEEVAESYSQEGNLKMAEEARQRAEQVRSHAEKEFSADVDESFKVAWKENFEQSAKAYPELDDQNSEFYQQVQRLIIEKPVLATYSRGIADAAEIVGMRGQVEKSSSLQEQIAALSAENDSLKSKLSIGGSAPSDGPSGDKSFKELSDTEQFQRLQQVAAAADARSS
jgi:hypothetical protein